MTNLKDITKQFKQVDSPDQLLRFTGINNILDKEEKVTVQDVLIHAKVFEAALYIF